MTLKNISFTFNRKRNNNRKLPDTNKNIHSTINNNMSSKIEKESHNTPLQKVECMIQNNLEHETNSKLNIHKEWSANINEYIATQVKKQVEEQLKENSILSITNTPSTNTPSTNTPSTNTPSTNTIIKSSQPMEHIANENKQSKRLNLNSETSAATSLNQNLLNELNSANKGTYDTWQRGSQYTDIYYNQGPVSISTMDPELLGKSNSNVYDISFSTTKTNSNPTQGDFLGDCVATTMNGKVIAAGQPGYNNNTGRVVIYALRTSHWEVLQIIEGATDISGHFGDSISMSQNLLAVGQPGASSIYVYILDPDQEKYINFVNKYYYGIGKKEQTYLELTNNAMQNSYNYQFGHSISISKYPNTDDNRFSLITGDPINGAVLYWKDGGIEKPGIVYQPVTSEICTTDNCMGLGYAVKTMYQTTNSTYYVPVYFISNPDDNFQPSTGDLIQKCGSVSVISYPNQLVPDNALNFKFYSPYMASEAYFGYSLDANPKLGVVCVSSPSLIMPNSGGTGIVETFAFEINQSEDPTQTPNEFDAEIYKVAPDISFNGATNFGNALDLDINSYYLSVGAPSFSTSNYANTFLYNIDLPASAKGGNNSIFTNIQDRFSGLQFTYDTSFVSPASNDNHNSSYGDAVSIIGINNTTYNLVIGSPESANNTGIVYGYSNLDKYYDLNVKGDIYIKHDLDICNNINVYNQATIKSAKIKENLRVEGDATIDGNLEIDGKINIENIVGDVSIDGSLNVANRLKATNAYITNNLKVDGKIYVDEIIYENTSLKDIDLIGDVSIDGSLNVTNRLKATDAHITNNLKVDASANISGNLDICGGQINLSKGTNVTTKITFADKNNQNGDYKDKGAIEYYNGSLEEKEDPPRMVIFSDRFVDFVESDYHTKVVSMDLNKKHVKIDGRANIIGSVNIGGNLDICGGEINLSKGTNGTTTKITFADKNNQNVQNNDKGAIEYYNGTDSNSGAPATMSIYSDGYVNFIESDYQTKVISMDLNNKKMDMSANLNVNGVIDVSGDIILNKSSLNALIQNAIPTGSVFAFAGQTGPEGYVICDGTSYSQTASKYESLYKVIGTTFGSSDGNFNVPDLRNKFIYGASITNENTETNEEGQDPEETTIGANVGNKTTTLKASMIPGICGDFIMNHNTGRTPLIYDFSGIWTDASINAQQTSYNYKDPNGVQSEVNNAFGFMQGSFYGQVYPDVSYNKYNYVPVSTGADYMQPRAQVAKTKVTLGEATPDSFSNTPDSLALAYYIKL